MSANASLRAPAKTAVEQCMNLQADESCVVVRGGDQTHGYGGRAVVVNLDTGETRGFLQGEEPSSFDEGDCP